MVELNPKYWIPELPGKLNGTVQTRFHAGSERWQLDIPELDLKGYLRRFPVNINGQFSARQADKGILPITATIDKLSAAIGQNSLTASGQLTENWNLQIQASGQSCMNLSGLTGQPFQQYSPDRQGRSTRSVLKVAVPDLRLRKLSIQQLNIQGQAGYNGRFYGQTQVNVQQLVNQNMFFRNCHCK